MRVDSYITGVHT